MKVDGMAASAVIAVALWSAAGGAWAAAPAVQGTADVRVALALPAAVDVRSELQAVAARPSDASSNDDAPLLDSKRLALWAGGIGVIVFLTRRRLDD